MSSQLAAHWDLFKQLSSCMCLKLSTAVTQRNCRLFLDLFFYAGPPYDEIARVYIQVQMG